MDRIAHDNPAVETIRATVARHGARRKRVELPEDADADVPTDEIVRLVIDETTHHARVEGGFADAGPHITGAHETPGRARSADGTNHLQGWLDDADRPAGSTVLVDVIEPGFAYGLRAPGEEAVYDAVEKPDEDLAAIARDLEDHG